MQPDALTTHLNLVTFTSFKSDPLNSFKHCKHNNAYLTPTYLTEDENYDKTTEHNNRTLYEGVLTTQISSGLKCAGNIN